MTRLVLFILAGIAAGCGAATHSLANSPEFTLPAARNIGNPARTDSFGDSVGIVGDQVAVGAPNENGGAAQSGQVHLFDADTSEVNRTLESPAPRPDGGFGAAIVIAGDHVYVGAPGEGRVYGFDATTGDLVATIAGPEDEDFGAALAVVGDTLAVGAPRRAVGQGAVYLYDRTTRALQGRIDSPLPSFSGAFGQSLAAFGTDLLVGAPGENGGTGAVHIVRVSDGTSRVRLVSPGAFVGGSFGESVANAAGDILVGAPGEGVAYVFQASGTLVHILDDPGPGSLFGVAVAYADGHLLVAALSEQGAVVHLFSAISGRLERSAVAGSGSPSGVALTTNNGIALVGIPAGGDALRGLATNMNCDTGEFEEQFFSPSVGTDNRFGDAICILDDGRVAVGEPGAASEDGRVHVFEPDGTFVVTFSPPTAGLGSNFGQRITTLGNRVVIAEPGGEENAQGVVYIANPATGLLDVTINSPDPVAGGRFGQSVAVVDGKILVGEPNGFDNSGEGQSGAAHAFTALGVLVHTLHEPTPSGNAEFGRAVAAGGTDYLVGAPNDDAAYCFDGTTGAFKQEYLPDGLTGTQPGVDAFGLSIAGDGTEVWVGAPAADVPDDIQKTDLIDAGLVFVFNQSSAANLAILESPDKQTGGNFGEMMSMSGNRVAITAVSESSQTPVLTGTPQPIRDGLVHLFEKSSRFRLARAESFEPFQDAEFGYGVFLLDDRIAIGEPFADVGQTFSAGTAYLFDIDGFGFMFSPNAQDGGAFGTSIAGCDDINALVGAPFEDNARGNAYVVDTTNNQATALPNNTSVGSGFGASVAKLGNGLIAVGAPIDQASGTVRIFDANLNEIGVVTNPDAGVTLQFGFSLAAVGTDRMVVGAPGNPQLTGTVQNLGGAYLIEVIDTGGTPSINVIQSVMSPLGQDDDEFGFSVADFDGDFLVGAPGEDGTAGNAYLFSAATGSQLASFQATSPSIGERFGNAVARIGNSVGPPEVLVGGPGVGIGSCTVYRFASGGTLTDTILDPDGDPFSLFGWSLKGNDDFTFIVGAPNGDGGTGIAYRMQGDGVMLDDAGTANPQIGGFYGGSVGCLTNGAVLVGAPLEDVNPAGAGRAARFGVAGQQPPPPPPPPMDDFVEFVAPTPTSGAGFGTQVAFAGTKILVSAPCDDGQRGSVFVFDGATAALLDTLSSPNPSVPGKFGCALAANALMIAVGASEEDAGEDGSGAAYLFSCETGALLLTFATGNPEIDGGFGKAIGVSSVNIGVGAPFEDVESSLAGGLGVPDAGRVYVYDCRVSQIIQTLISPLAQVLGLFGCCVHLDGNNVYVGACGENGAEGRVYCFDLVTGTLQSTVLPGISQSGQFFGTSCTTLPNGNVVAGAPGFDDDQQLSGTQTGPEDSGIVYVIDPADGEVVKELRPPNPVSGGGFGVSVATNGSIIVVGAPGELRGDGRVYVFDAVTCELLATLVNPTGGAGGNLGVSVAVLADNILAGAPSENDAAGKAVLNPPEEENE